MSMKVTNEKGNVKQFFKIAVVGTEGFHDEEFVMRRLENIVLPKAEEYEVILLFDDVPEVCHFAYAFAEEHGILNMPCVSDESLGNAAPRIREIDLLSGTRMVIGFLTPKCDVTPRFLEKARERGAEVVSFMYDPKTLEEDGEDEHQ